MKIPLFCQQMAKEWYFLLAKHCLEEFKLDCQLRRLAERTIKGYYNNTLNFLSIGCKYRDGKHTEHHHCSKQQGQETGCCFRDPKHKNPPFLYSGISEEFVTQRH